MKLKFPEFTSSSHFPFFSKPPEKKPTDEQANIPPFSDELLGGVEIPSDNLPYLLAEALDHLQRDATLSDKERERLKELVVEDALDIASSVLPQRVSMQLGVTSPLPLDREVHHPTLPETYLLASAYDHTNDETIRDALSYILTEDAPPLSETLVSAYEKAQNDHAPIMSTYQKMVALTDDRLSKPRSRDELELVLNFREATPPGKSNPEWEERVRRNERD